jgi:hypothetical protein
MNTGKWGLEFTEARQRLLESDDFNVLRERGHDLRDGVVLTSVSDVPFEMSFKCNECRTAFWFENAAWSTGGIAEWHLSAASREVAGQVCAASGRRVVSGTMAAAARQLN